MAYSFSKLRGEAEDELETRVAQMTEELAALRKIVAKQGAAALENSRTVALDIYDTISEHVSDNMPAVKRRAKEVEDIARANPATAAAVGLVVVGLIVTLFARSGSSEPSAPVKRASSRRLKR